LIFERTGGVVKAHRGVHSEFARLARDGPNIDKSFPVFLTQAYNSEKPLPITKPARAPSFRPNAPPQLSKRRAVLSNRSVAFLDRAARKAASGLRRHAASAFLFGPSVVFANSELIDKLGVAVLPSIPLPALIVRSLDGRLGSQNRIRTHNVI